jgi:tRNA(Ile)-lysidine synthase
MKLNPFEFSIYQALKPLAFEGQRLLVACSGGADSVALLHLLSKCAPKLKFRIGVITVHHGREPSGFRDRAVEIVRRAARQKKIDFHLARFRGANELKSEADFRSFRHAVIEKVREEFGYSRIVFAHHADDLLETRLIRLLRGTGPQGLRAMEFDRDVFLRPFLFTQRNVLRLYAQDEHLEWVDDPSNDSKDPFRNWMRLDLLPSLEAKRPGSTRAFSRSLDAIVEMCSTQIEDSHRFVKANPEENFLSRPYYESLAVSDRRQALAALLLKVGARSFARSHIDEIRKRIEVPRKALQFRILGLRVRINAEQIFVSKVDLPLT